MIRPPPRSPLFPYPTLFRSQAVRRPRRVCERGGASRRPSDGRGESGERGGASRRPSDGRGESVSVAVRAAGRPTAEASLGGGAGRAAGRPAAGGGLGGGGGGGPRPPPGRGGPGAGGVLVGGGDAPRLYGRALDEVRRRYGVVFQGGALFDSMTCAGNVAFPLREKLRLRAAEVATRVEAALTQVGLEGMGSKYPAEVDRKSTRLNSSHGYISYAVFCLKKKKQ